MLQDDQTVSFQPMYVDGDQPWVTKLFVLYLMIVFVVSLVRVALLAANLRKLRKAKKHPIPTPLSDALWADCYARARSFKDLSVVTFLLSLLTFAWCTANDFSSIRAVKTPNVAYVLVRTGDGLVALAFGLIICIALYSAAMLSESAIRRRRRASSMIDLDSKSA
jgi:hypothetical protein